MRATTEKSYGWLVLSTTQTSMGIEYPWRSKSGTSPPPPLADQSKWICPLWDEPCTVELNWIELLLVGWMMYSWTELTLVVNKVFLNRIELPFVRWMMHSNWIELPFVGWTKYSWTEWTALCRMNKVLMNWIELPFVGRYDALLNWIELPFVGWTIYYRTDLNWFTPYGTNSILLNGKELNCRLCDEQCILLNWTNWTAPCGMNNVLLTRSELNRTGCIMSCCLPIAKALCCIFYLWPKFYFNSHCR